MMVAVFQKLKFRTERKWLNWYWTEEFHEFFEGLFTSLFHNFFCLFWAGDSHKLRKKANGAQWLAEHTDHSAPSASCLSLFHSLAKIKTKKNSWFEFWIQMIVNFHWRLKFKKRICNATQARRKHEIWKSQTTGRAIARPLLPAPWLCQTCYMKIQKWQVSLLGIPNKQELHQ